MTNNNQALHKSVVVISDTSQWADGTSVAYQVQEQYLNTKKDVTYLIMKLETEKNTNNKIQYADSLIKLLKLQKDLEENKAELKKANEIILDIQRKLELHKKR